MSGITYEGHPLPGPLTMGQLIDDEVARGELDADMIDYRTDRADIVYHHEWGKTIDGDEESQNQLCCVVAAGHGDSTLKYYTHNLDTKTLIVTFQWPSNVKMFTT